MKTLRRLRHPKELKTRMSDIIEGVITDVLKAEGWDKYTNHPADKGGPTKWGITLAAWQEACGDPSLTDADVRKITEPQARSFYRSRYVLGPRFHELPPLLMELVIDCGVNHGIDRATKWVQKAAGAVQDGVIGPQTLAAVRNSNTTAMYLDICAYRVRFYGALVTRDPSQAAFASGWNNRAAKFIVALADLLKAS
jgi:lysozyme family protein